MPLNFINADAQTVFHLIHKPTRHTVHLLLDHPVYNLAVVIHLF